MSFVETRFPDDIAYGSSGGPNYLTSIVTTDGGYEKRNLRWQAARARYNVSHGIKTKAQADTLIAFFRARKGRAHGFRFKDWSDYKASGESIGTGDGATRVFQLVKHYTSGGVSEARVIAKPVAGSVAAYANGALQSSATVDTTTGKVTFATAPASGAAISADFEFDVPVRFDTDSLNASLDGFGAQSWRNIGLVEIRV